MDIIKLRIDAIRKRRKISKTALAQTAGIARGSLYQILSGDHWPNRETLSSLARALGVEPWELIEGAPLVSLPPDIELPEPRAA